MSASSSPRPLLIAVCAGEASGDLLGAHLIEAIKAEAVKAGYPEVRFVGIGGPRMIGAGCESLFAQETLAVRGFTEVLGRLPQLLRLRRRFIRAVTALRPDVFVGIDAPDFNLGIEGTLKAAGIPTVHYVSPSVWAWREKRVGKIVRQADRVLCLFPMEPPLYHAAGGKADFVGHPLAQTLPLTPDRHAARLQLKLNTSHPVITLMPGSRVSEIDYLGELFLHTAQLIRRQLPETQFLLPAATFATRAALQQLLAQPEFRHENIRLISGHASLAATASDAALVASGTATLEVALCHCPMVVSYKVSPLTYAWVKRQIRTPWVSLPNVLLGEAAVPEILQDKADAQTLSQAVLGLLDHARQTATVEKFKSLHRLLRRDTAALAAHAVLTEAGISLPEPLLEEPLPTPGAAASSPLP